MQLKENKLDKLCEKNSSHKVTTRTHAVVVDGSNESLRPAKQEMTFE